MDGLLRLTGTALIGFSLLDVFLTVLYVRSRAGLMAPLLSQGLWRLFHRFARLLGARGTLLLSFAGPLNLTLIAASWFLFLALGFALLYWPELGTGLQASSSTTPTDFVTAFYYSGFCLTTLGVGDLTPTTGGIRLLTVIEAALGFSFFTLTITYFLSVYGALQRRNTLASILHHKTGGTGDARVYLSAILSGNATLSASRELSNLATQVAELVEAHSFYPVLHYFHFRQLRYGLPRIAFVLLDMASLARTLPFSGRERLHAAASQLQAATCDLLDRVDKAFLTGQDIDSLAADAKETVHIRAHFREAATRLTGTTGAPDSELQGEEDRYVGLRLGWHPYIAATSEFMGYELEAIIRPPERSQV